MKRLCFLAATIAMAQNGWPPPGMRCPERTIVKFDIASDDQAKLAKFRDEHLSYLLTLMKEGKLVTAGPLQNHQHAMMIFTSSNWADVEAALKDEPFTREGVIKVASHDVWLACEVAK